MEALRVSPGYEKILPQEYQDLVADGPFGRDLSVKDLGTFKELIEEHPLCAGCGLGLSIRLVVASLPNPENTVIVGTTGCNSILMPQLAMHNVHALFGNQNAVASGLRRALRLRYPEKNKDVVVVAGDGGVADIGLSPTLHSWFRQEKFTTIMLDNEGYSNTGGQESGMTRQGMVVNMAPLGKKFAKPFPDQEVIAAAARARTIIVPEHNITGWLAREIKSRVSDNAKIFGGPRVFGGMTMPPEVIVTETKKLLAERGGHLGLTRPLVAARG